MFGNFNMDIFKQIYGEIIIILVFLCFIFILYRLKQTKAISNAAYNDALTGKGNRYKFNQVMERLVTDADSKFALCFLDLDGFKHINDNMGHDAR